MQCRPNPDERTDLIHFILFFLTFDILDNNIAESVCVECSYIAAKHLAYWVTFFLPPAVRHFTLGFI